jgi:hypothetical protein
MIYGELTLKDRNKMTVKKIIFVLGLNMLLTGSFVSSAFAGLPQLVGLSSETGENQSPYGDSIKLKFNQDMRSTLPDNRIRSSINIPKAPAGYESVSNSVYISAKNYTVKIIPELVGRTTPYEGNWFDLGGLAIFDPYDPTGKTVLLLLKNQAQDIFKPGDRIELTVSNTITNAAQESVDSQHRVLKGIAN